MHDPRQMFVAELHVHVQTQGHLSRLPSLARFLHLLSKVGFALALRWLLGKMVDLVGSSIVVAVSGTK